MRVARPMLVLVVALVVGACSSDEPTADSDVTAGTTATIAATTTLPQATTTSLAGSTSTSSTSTSTSTTSASTTSTSTSTSTSSSTSTSTSTTSTSTTLPAAWTDSEIGTELVPYRPLALDEVGPGEELEIGESVDGRAIIAERHGDPDGRPVLVIGVIHGDEDAGVAIVDELRDDVPDGVDLWLVESMNPDGQAAHDRHNANDVDLNRNFPYRWGAIGQPGDGQYAGTGPASEPETRAIVNLIAQLHPDIAIWYHQDLYVISPSEGRDGRIRQRYAELTGLPLGSITGGTYTGVAATWARNELRPSDGVAFIVELGPTLSDDEAELHANAVRTIAAEG